MAVGNHNVIGYLISQVMSSAIMISISSIWFALCLVDIVMMLFVSSNGYSSGFTSGNGNNPHKDSAVNSIHTQSSAGENSGNSPTSSLDNNYFSNTESDYLFLKHFMSSAQWKSVHTFFIIPLLAVRFIGVIRDLHFSFVFMSPASLSHDFSNTKRDVAHQRLLDLIDGTIVLASIIQYYSINDKKKSHLIAFAIAGFSVFLLFVKLIKRCYMLSKQIGKIEAANSSLRRSIASQSDASDVSPGGSNSKKPKLKKQLSFNEVVAVHAENGNGPTAGITVVTEKKIQIAPSLLSPSNNSASSPRSANVFAITSIPVIKQENDNPTKVEEKPADINSNDIVIPKVSEKVEIPSSQMTTEAMLTSDIGKKENKIEDDAKKKEREEMDRVISLLIGSISLLVSVATITTIHQKIRR